MRICHVGLNHRTAPVDLRERAAVDGGEIADILVKLMSKKSVREVALLSTCNRVEFTLVTHDPDAAIAEVHEWFVGRTGHELESITKHLYSYTTDDAVRHLFAVASGLDSLVLGEPQILGQVKGAYEHALTAGTAGHVLHRLYQATFSAAKLARSETAIGKQSVNVSSCAVELAKRIFGDLTGKAVMLIGAGEMAELAVEHLIRNNTGEIFVANRTFETGVELAKQFNGRAIKFEEISESLKSVDIIISSTGSPDFVIARNTVKSVIRSRRNRPLFFIDIAVPRDIDPEVNWLTNSYVYDIDDLQGVIDENLEDRQREAIKGERIIDETVIGFRNWYLSLEVVPTIVALRNKLESIAENEVKKTLKSNQLPPQSNESIKKMTAAIINKVLHGPTLFLKESGMGDNKSQHIDIIRKLFKLDD